MTDKARIIHLASVPNLITLGRTLAAITLGFAALVQGSMVLLVAAYACYWIGDMADGFWARRLDQETRFGAVFDIVSDRACCAILVCTFVTLRPEMWLPLTVYFVQFILVDLVLSLSFLYWPVVSPNYFDDVDRQTWILNWSKPAKAINTVATVLIALSGIPLLALATACLQLVVKLISARRVLKLIPGAL